MVGERKSEAAHLFQRESRVLGEDPVVTIKTDASPVTCYAQAALPSPHTVPSRRLSYPWGVMRLLTIQRSTSSLFSRALYLQRGTSMRNMAGKLNRNKAPAT